MWKRDAGVTGLKVRMPISFSYLDTLEEFDGAAFGEGDHGLLPVPPLPLEAPHALELAAHVDHVDARHLDLERLFHGPLDLDLGRVADHLEGHLVRGLALAGVLLGQQRPDDDFAVLSHRESAPSSDARASRVTTSLP